MDAAHSPTQFKPQIMDYGNPTSQRSEAEGYTVSFNQDKTCKVFSASYLFDPL